MAKSDKPRIPASSKTSFTWKLAEEICIRLSNGQSLVSICKTEGFPSYTTVMNWLWQDSVFKDTFLEMYARARDMQADYMADEIQEIADDASYDWEERVIRGQATTIADHENIQRSHLRVDARKWMAAKLKPRKYSEKFYQEITDTSKDIEVIVTHGDGILLDDKASVPRLDSSPAADSPIEEKT